MSLTLVSAPNYQDNRAQFEVSTTLTEDSSHNNLRVKAELYILGAVFATKVMPKGLLDAFDFTKILEAAIDIYGSGLLAASTSVELKQGAAGSGLSITWTNDGVDPMDSFSSTGDMINSCTHNGTIHGVGKAYTNAISLNAGDIICVHWYDFENNDNKPTLYLDIGGELQAAIVPEANDDFVVYFQARSTGSGHVYIECPATTSIDMVTGLEVYKLTPDDLWKMYHVKFTEQYENSSGVTTTGTTLTTPNSYLFFKAPLLDSADFANTHLCESATTWPLLPRRYAKLGVTEKPYSEVHPAQGATRSSWSVVVLSSRVLTRQLRLDAYNANDVFQTTLYSTPAKQYHPVAIMQIPLSLLTSTYAYFNARIAATTTIFSGSFFVGHNVKRVELDLRLKDSINLFWENSYGGISSWDFYSSYQEIGKVLRETYKDANYLDRPLRTHDKRQLKLQTAIINEDIRAEWRRNYLLDLLRAKRIWFYYGEYNQITECTLLSDSIELRPIGDRWQVSLTVEFYMEFITDLL